MRAARPASRAVIVAAGVLVCGVLVCGIASGCSSSGGSGGGSGSGPTGTYSTAAHTTFTMPNLVGRPLPAAEKAAQTAARNLLFTVRAQDATPAGRTPEPARGWKVCGQDVPAGQETDQSATLTLTVVRVGEDCPR